MEVKMRFPHRPGLVSRLLPAPHHVIGPHQLLGCRVEGEDVRLHLLVELPDVRILVALVFSPPVCRDRLLIQSNQSEPRLVKAARALNSCVKYCHIVTALSVIIALHNVLRRKQ